MSGTGVESPASIIDGLRRYLDELQAEGLIDADYNDAFGGTSSNGSLHQETWDEFHHVGHRFRNVLAWLRDRPPVDFQNDLLGAFPTTLCLVKLYRNPLREGRAVVRGGPRLHANNDFEKEADDDAMQRVDGQLAKDFVSDVTGLALLGDSFWARPQAQDTSADSEICKSGVHAFTQLAALTTDKDTYKVLVRAWREKRRISRLQELQLPSIQYIPEAATRVQQKDAFERLLASMLLPLRRSLSRRKVSDRFFGAAEGQGLAKVWGDCLLHYVLGLEVGDRGDALRKLLLGPQFAPESGLPTGLRYKQKALQPLQFNELRLRNFKPFKDETFRMDQTLQLVFGENGTGKSSLVDAIEILWWQSSRPNESPSRAGSTKPREDWAGLPGPRISGRSLVRNLGDTAQLCADSLPAVKLTEDSTISKPQSNPWIIRQEDVAALRYQKGFRYPVVFIEPIYSLLLWRDQQQDAIEKSIDRVLQQQELFDKDAVKQVLGQRMNRRHALAVRIAKVVIELVWAGSLMKRIGADVSSNAPNRVVIEPDELYTAIFRRLKESAPYWTELVSQFPDRSEGKESQWRRRWVEGLIHWSEPLARKEELGAFERIGKDDYRRDEAKRRQRALRQLLTDLKEKDWVLDLEELLLSDGMNLLDLLVWLDLNIKGADSSAERPPGYQNFYRLVYSWCSVALREQDWDELSRLFTFLITALHGGEITPGLSFRVGAGERDLQITGLLSLDGKDSKGIRENEISTFLNSAQQNLLGLAAFILGQCLQAPDNRSHDGRVPERTKLPLIVLDDVAQDLDDANQRSLARTLRRIAAILSVRLLVTTNQRAFFHSIQSIWAGDADPWREPQEHRSGNSSRAQGTNHPKDPGQNGKAPLLAVTLLGEPGRRSPRHRVEAGRTTYPVTPGKNHPWPPYIRTYKTQGDID